MEKIVLKVGGMSCAHCVKAVTSALTAIPGVGSARADLEAKTAAVEYDPTQTTLEAIRLGIEDAGYEIL